MRPIHSSILIYTLLFLCLIIPVRGMTQEWSECNDYVGKWKFGKNSVLEIKKEKTVNDQPPTFDFSEAHYTDWEYSSSEFKKGEWHFLFKRDPKAAEINNEIPASIRDEISGGEGNNKNTWWLEIVLKRDEGTTFHNFDPCNNTLAMKWYKGIINWDKVTKKLDKVFNYPMSEARTSPYTNPDKQKVTSHIEEYTGVRKTYSIPEWNSLVFDWKNDDQSVCGMKAKSKINGYFLSKTLTHAFTEFFKALKPATKNPLGDKAWETIADAIKGKVKDYLKDKAKEFVKNKFKHWCDDLFDACRYEFIETHVFYEPQSYGEDLLIGSNITLVFLVDKYAGKGSCLIIVDNSKVKDEKDCRENLFISGDIREILPEKEGEGGGMKKWHIMGEIEETANNNGNKIPDNNTNTPCNPSYDRVKKVENAFNNAKAKARGQEQAKNTAWQKMKGADKKHTDYLVVKSVITAKQDEIKAINLKIEGLGNGFPYKREAYKKDITDLGKEIKTQQSNLKGLEPGEQDYQDKKTAYSDALKAWKEMICTWLQNAIRSEKWDQEDIDYMKDCYYDGELKDDKPKCD